MSFFSTRGGACVTASQAILYGLAENGGLYVPAMFPHISYENIVEMVGMDYEKRAVSILKYFLEDFSLSEIEQAVAGAYGGGKFDDAKIAPLNMLDGRTAVLELFHGPTLAFKDMALQLLPHLTTLAAKKNAEENEIAILVATSGDTGKAALEGFKDVPGTSCTVFYPKNGVSHVQEMQMTTTGGDNTHVISVEGNFDDAQTGVKALFSSEKFQAEMAAMGKRLSSANSINFGRLAPQIVYYFSAYADLLKTHQIGMGDKVNFVVPTGNFGNILAAYYAMQMGLPVGRLICASNHNNVLSDFFNSGIYSTHRTFMKTTSPSMDILVSSNLERLLFELCERDGDLVSVWMNLLNESGSYSIGEQRLEEIRKTFTGDFANDRETAWHIKTVYERYRYVMDPHTAVAGHVLNRYREETGDSTLSVIVSTASPFKFSDDVLRALGADFTPDTAARKLAELTSLDVPKQVAELENLPVRHFETCEKNHMAEAVIKSFSK
jgi:threonine synthase